MSDHKNMITTKKRGGKTAQPKYLQELAKIAPRWAKLVEMKGVDAAQRGAHRIDGKELDISAQWKCVVGEAWGFSDDYGSYGGHLISKKYGKRYCPECDEFGTSLITFLEDEFAENTLAFVKHFTKEHGQ